MSKWSGTVYTCANATKRGFCKIKGRWCMFKTPDEKCEDWVEK